MIVQSPHGQNSFADLKVEILSSEFPAHLDLLSAADCCGHQTGLTCLNTQVICIWLSLGEQTCGLNGPTCSIPIQMFQIK